MADRIARPPVRLRGGLPDGNLNGSGDIGTHFLKAEPDRRFAVIELARRQLVHDDETGGDVAVLGVAAIEFADQDALQRLLLAHREVRTGVGTLPFDDPEPATDADRARDLEHRILTWADQQGVDARQEWEGYFGEGDSAPVGPRGAALMHLLEFAGERGITTQPLAAVPDSDDPGEADEPDGDGLDGVPAGSAWLNDPDDDSEPAGQPAFSD